MPQYPQELRRRAVEAVLAGSSRRAVAQELGVSRTAVAAWAREAGVPSEPAGTATARADGRGASRQPGGRRPARRTASSPTKRRSVAGTSRPRPAPSDVADDAGSAGAGENAAGAQVSAPQHESLAVEGDDVDNQEDGSQEVDGQQVDSQEVDGDGTPTREAPTPDAAVAARPARTSRPVREPEPTTDEIQLRAPVVDPATHRGRGNRPHGRTSGLDLASWPPPSIPRPGAAADLQPAADPHPSPDGGSSPSPHGSAGRTGGRRTDVPGVRDAGAALARPAPLLIRRRRHRPAWVLAAAAAVVVVAAGATAVAVTTGRQTDDVAASYARLADAVDAAYLAHQGEYCAHVAEVVAGVGVFDRAVSASVTHLAIVASADSAFDRRARDAAAVAREDLVVTLEGAVPSSSQRQLQAAYGAAADPAAACLDDPPRQVERVPAPDVPHLQDMQDLLDRAEDGVMEDTSNLGRVVAAVAATAPEIAEVAQERREPEPDVLPSAEVALTAADLVDVETQMLDAVDAMQESRTPGTVMDATAMLADYAYAGQTLAGGVIVLQGVALDERPSVQTPLLVPERSLLAAIEAIPDDVGTPPPGPATDADG